MSDYFAQAEEQLDWVFDVAMQLATDQQWKLIQHTVTRLNSVLEQIDDSNGERFGVEALINVQMPMILNRLEWSEEEKAQWMFERMTHHEFDVYPQLKPTSRSFGAATQHFYTCVAKPLRTHH